MNDLLSVGDWRLMRYGFNNLEFYVLRIKGDMVQIGRKQWCVSSSEWMDKGEFLARSKPLGRGKWRWWRMMLPWLNDFICPFTAYR